MKLFAVIRQAAGVAWWHDSTRNTTRLAVSHIATLAASEVSYCTK